MHTSIKDLLTAIRKETNPGLTAGDISYFIIDSLKGNKVSLYEAYVLQIEALKFQKIWYTQPVWNGKVQVSTCLNIINQKFLAHIFHDEVYAARLKETALLALELNREKRTHYILDNYLHYLDANNNPALLEKLLKIRKDYDNLSDNDGPYHCESFPYHFYSPEEILLRKEEQEKHRANKRLSEDIEYFITELSTL